MPSAPRLRREGPRPRCTTEYQQLETRKRKGGGPSRPGLCRPDHPSFLNHLDVQPDGAVGLGRPKTQVRVAAVVQVSGTARVMVQIGNALGQAARDGTAHRAEVAQIMPSAARSFVVNPWEMIFVCRRREDHEKQRTPGIRGFDVVAPSGFEPPLPP